MIEDEGLPVSIGLYKVQRRIGAGGMGVVYLAASPSGREVAVKVIRQELADDSEFRTRFRQEVAAARRVSGAFTAAVVDADPHADSPWMATVYIQGVSLREQVRTHGPLRTNALLSLSTGLAEALRDIHRAGLVHRDLKPDNVLLTDDGPRVIDFGIARAVDSQSLTRTGRVVGTLPFMAPEQAQSAKDAGPLADVFALGSTLVYAASGHGPFDAGNPYTVAYKVVHEEPDLTNVPDVLHLIIKACLDKTPESRPTAEELLILLASPGQLLGRPRSTRRLARYLVAGVSTVAVMATAAWFTVTTGGAPHGSGPQGLASPSVSQSTPAINAGPLVEPIPFTQPRGWALWEQKVWGHSESSAACDAVAGALLCTTDKNAAMLLSLQDGHVQWRYQVSDTRYENTLGASDGLAYIEVLAGSAPVQLIALDMKNGHVRWTIPLGNREAAQFIGSTLYFLGADHHIRVLDVHTGKALPRRSPRIPTLDGKPELLEGDDGNLYVRSDNQARPGTSVTSVDADTLKVLWTTATEDRLDELEQAGKNGAVFAKRASDGRFAALVSITPAGSLRRIPLQQTIGREGILAGGTFYTSRSDGTLTAFAVASGKRLWTTNLGAESPSRPVIDGTHLYVSVADARILCLDTISGRQLWRSAPRRDPEGSLAPELDLYRANPVIVGGTVYAKSDRGTVFAITPPKA